MTAVFNPIRWHWGAGALHPAHQIQCREGSFYSEGADPQFRLAGVLPAGWYWLEAGLTIPTARTVARLYLDSGQGESQEGSQALPLRSGRIGKRLIRLARPAKVRFDPLTSAGTFAIDHFKLRRVPQWVARARMQRKLLSLHPRYRVNDGAGVSLPSARLPGSVDELWQEYHRLYAHDGVGLILYQEWQEGVEAVNNKRFAHEVAQAAGRQWTMQDDWPLISVLLPIFNTPAHLLQRCIESVLRQSYPKWQLCIADDRSTLAHVRPLLERYAAQDERIRLEFRAANGHIAQASNSALALATGEYVGLLDHDDELAEHALFCVARALADHPEAQIIYSDEDKLDESGQRCDPYFKPDFSPDLLLAQNYFGHFCVFRRSLVCRAGAFRAGFEGSQDYDLILRCLTQLTDTNGVLHLPHVLYHWRKTAGSTALSPDEKSYAYDAAQRALQQHLDSQKPGARVEIVAPGLYRQHWPLADSPKVSIVVPTRDGLDVLKPCIDSIVQRTQYTNYEIVVVDNQSCLPETAAYLDELQESLQGRLRVLAYDQPFNYSAINNYAAAHASGDVLALLNNDIEVLNADWLSEMVAQATRPGVGCVGAKLYYPDGTLQHGGVILGIGGVAGHAHQFAARDAVGYFNRLRVVHNVSAVTGAALVVKKGIYLQVGGMDEANLPVAFNDVDFCLRVRQAGYRNVWTPYAELVHHESKTRGADNTPDKQSRFERECRFMQEKWAAMLQHDPYYNPNLSLQREDYSLCMRAQ